MTKLTMRHALWAIAFTGVLRGIATTTDCHACLSRGHADRLTSASLGRRLVYPARDLTGAPFNRREREQTGC
jgi:hypothetical protein